MSSFLDKTGLEYFWGKIKSYVTGLGYEANQNAFSNVKVGSTTVVADTKTDTLELVAGSNVTLTPDATNDKVTITATNMRIVPSGSTASSSTNTAFVATVDGITALSDGVSLYLKNTIIDSAENCTLNINGLGAKPIYLYGATGTDKRVKNEFVLNSTMYFIYNATRVTGGCWEMFFFDGVGNFPIFETHYNSTTQEFIVTCNKTYGECWDLCEVGSLIGIHDLYMDNEFSMRECVTARHTSRYELIYTPYGCPYDIKYNQNETIEFTIPSSDNITPALPVATKGSVNNNSIIVTPSVTYSKGWISLENEGTVSGDSVTVSASELVSGTLTINSSGTKDVTNYASVSVGAGTEGTPTATKGTVSSHSITVTPSVTNTAGYISGGTKTGTGVTVSASELVSGTKSISSNGTDIDVTNYESVDVSVPTGTARTSSDITVSGATVTVPAGLYSSEATKSVASGTAGTPTASKGTVSNHAITVTPTVTNTTGYITGGTKTGTGVSVSASELVSGTLTIDSSGTKDVTNYASASVAAGSAGTPSASKGTVSNHSVAITPSVTNTTGFITGSTKTGTAVTVSASELVSGNLAITDNGTGIDVTNYATVSVAVDSGGSSGYTLTTVAAQQTVTPTSNGTYYNATLSMTTGLESGADYIITYNGTEYYFTCQVLWGTNYLLGDINYFYGTTGLPYPFGIIWMSGNTATLAVGSGTAVTIKIEKLELTGGGGGDSNIFVIGLAYQNNAFVPDCTFAEYKAAYQAGKDIYIVSTDGIPVGNPNLQSDYVGCAIYLEDSDDTNYFVKTYGFDWSENLSPQTSSDQTYYNTGFATAVPADVAQGKIFFNGSGYQVGTASGGSSVKTATGTFTGNGTRQVTISCNFEPDLIYWNSDPGTTASSGTVSGIIARGMMAANRYRNNTTSNSHYAVTPITNMNTAGSSYSHRATYENSTVTLYCWSSGARSLFTNNRTYSYTFIKWTQ